MPRGCGSPGVSCLLSWCWRVCARVRLPFRMVLRCESGTRERKPQVEQYGLDDLAASGEAVLAGVGARGGGGGARGGGGGAAWSACGREGGGRRGGAGACEVSCAHGPGRTPVSRGRV